MGSLAVTGAGAILGGIGGFFLGGPAGALQGAALGFAVGTAAGNALFPQSTPDGSRLGDLTISTSTYGTVRPLGVGHIRVAGNLIWAKEIRETKNGAKSRGVGKGGGKGGGGTGGKGAYSYSCSFAMAFCEGPVAKIVRIWANQKIIYDETTTTDQMKKQGLSFRFYPGSETQIADSLIEDDKGVGNVPGFRGLCYLVFDDLPLEDYGNRLPSIQAEVAFEADVLQEPTSISPAVVALGTRRTSTLAIDPVRGRGFILNNAPMAGVTELDLSTMTVVGEHSFTDILGDNAWDTLPVSDTNQLYVAHDQNLYFTEGNNIHKINPYSWQVLNTEDLPDNFLGNATGHNMTSLVYMSHLGLKSVVVVQDFSISGHIMFYDCKEEIFLPDQEWPTPGNVFGGGIQAMCVGNPGIGRGEAWAVGTGDGFVSDDTLYIGKMTSYETASLGLISTAPLYTYLTSFDEMAAFDYTDFDAAVDGWRTAKTAKYAIIYDETDNSLLVLAEMINGAAVTVWVFKWSDPAGLIWKTELSVTGGITASLSKVSGGFFVALVNQSAIKINSATGEIISTTSWSGTGLHAGSPQAYDTVANAVLAPATVGAGPTTIWTKFQMDRSVAGTASVGEMVGKIMAAANVDSADYDTTDIDGITVDGYIMSNRTTAAGAVQPLLQLFQIDVIERDYVLYFEQRGKTSVVSIAEDDMVRAAGDAPEAYKEGRAQEVDLPAKLTVSYSDPAQDMQTNTQAAQRVRSPVATVATDQQTDVQIGLTMSADLARQHAETLLFSAWVSRHSFQFSLPPGYGYLDPGDVVTLTLNNGYSGTARLGAIDQGVDYSLQTTAYSEADGIYSSTASGFSGTGMLTQSINRVAPSFLALLDIPLLRDQDDVQLQGMRVYWGAGPYTDTTWRGATLQSSYDATAWADLDVSVQEVAWGHIIGALPDALNTFHTVFDQSITVQMIVGGDTLESVTELQMANGFNAAAVLKENGEVEVMQFLTVTDLGGDQYTLTSLNRGCRGTDTMSAAHTAGSPIIMLHTDTIFPVVVPLVMFNQMGYYRAVTAGMLAQSAIVDGQIFHGRDHMPYSPVAVAAATSGGDIIITWLRRARVNGALHDGDDDVPLGESIEAYEIDVYDGAGTTVLRTLDATTETVTYTAADITTDFGSPPATLYLAAYQMSSAVGRGFGCINLVEVTP